MEEWKELPRREACVPPWLLIPSSRQQDPRLQQGPLAHRGPTESSCCISPSVPPTLIRCHPLALVALLTFHPHSPCCLPDHRPWPSSVQTPQSAFTRVGAQPSHVPALTPHSALPHLPLLIHCVPETPGQVDGLVLETHQSTWLQ